MREGILGRQGEVGSTREWGTCGVMRTEEPKQVQQEEQQKERSTDRCK